MNDPDYYLLQMSDSPILDAVYWGFIAGMNAIALMGDYHPINWMNFGCLAINLVGFESACREIARRLEQ